MSGAFAENTSVSVEKSKAEIEKILSRYGATKFMYATEETRSVVAFIANGKHVRFLLPLPDSNAEEFRYTPTGRTRKSNTVNEKYEQEIRRRWRALALSIKGKLEAVESGIMSFEEEFFAHIVLPNGKTVSEEALPMIETAYQNGRMPKLLPFLDN